MNTCPSTFLGVPCQLPANHASPHLYEHSSGHQTHWQDTAADPKEATA